MEIRCAWCNKIIREDGSHSEHPLISHGICPDCAFNLEFNKIPLQEFINSLDPVVIVVDSDVRIQTANQTALTHLQKPLSQIKDQLGGDIIECAYAVLPGGCGKTEKCSACGIRCSVNQTYSTGEPLNDVKFFQYIEGPEGIQRVTLTLSTKKVGNSVVLRIDGI
ncbi:MAG: hypothetical protein ACTSVU_08165 [Promethearchaeota archaeon]